MSARRMAGRLCLPAHGGSAPCTRCSRHPDDARPSVSHPGAVGASPDWQASNMTTVMVPRDGGEMSMTIWTPAGPPRAAILLIQEIFGVGAYIRAVGQRLADLGYLVGAPELYWRFAPGFEGSNDDAGMQ